jgi:hypothetical protein
VVRSLYVGEATVEEVGFSSSPEAMVKRSLASDLTFADEERPKRTTTRGALEDPTEERFSFSKAARF